MRISPGPLPDNYRAGERYARVGPEGQIENRRQAVGRDQFVAPRAFDGDLLLVGSQVPRVPGGHASVALVVDMESARAVGLGEGVGQHVELHAVELGSNVKTCVEG
jgi:hypothetical protein